MPRRATGGAPRIAGIYAIRNTRTGAVYIGSTRNLRQRWTIHRCDLRAGRHATKPLQAAWVEDGPNAFVLELLEAMPLPLAASTLNAAEKAWHERMAAAGKPLYTRRFRPRREKADSYGREPTVTRTIRIPRSLLARLRLLANDAGQSLNDYIVAVLSSMLERALEIQEKPDAGRRSGAGQARGV